ASAAPRTPIRRLVLAGLAVSLLLAVGLSFYASGHPDGLEYVAGSAGFVDSAEESATAGSPLADYGVSGVENARLSGGLAGAVGVLATGLVMAGLVLVLQRLSRRRG
ncbi:MAG: PDGLE domain-containing protein, partial [Dermatophilaceae bacterium]